MFELNEQELEQVAGGHTKYGSTSTSGGIGVVDFGAVASTSKSSSIVTSKFSASSASNTTAGIGFGVGVQSGAESSAGAKH
jgi:hypothetical protein